MSQENETTELTINEMTSLHCIEEMENNEKQIIKLSRRNVLLSKQLVRSHKREVKEARKRRKNTDGSKKEPSGFNKPKTSSSRIY